MLPTSTPHLRRPPDQATGNRDRTGHTVRQPIRLPHMRARRVAALMVVFGIALGCVELVIVLSYL